MHITELQISNVKRIVAVRIEPKTDGSLVIIGGNNAQGKSSLLDSIAMAFGGGDAIPTRPIRDGEDRAEIVVKTEEFTITRKFKTGSNPTLVVTATDGTAIKSPQTLLDTLTSKVSFDPLAFTRMKSSEQAETVKRLAGLDFTKLDEEKEKVYAARTALNRDIKLREASVKVLPSYPDAGLELKSASDISERLVKATAENAANEKRRAELDDANDKIQAGEDRIQRAEAEVTRLKDALFKAEGFLSEVKGEKNELILQRDKIAEEIRVLVDVDLEPIQAEMRNAEAHNEQVRANIARAAAEKELRAKEDESKKKTERLEAIEADKAKQLRKAKFPIAELSFTGNGVTYKGVPFEQASAAEQMRVSMAIGGALQPKLKVALIRDGSLLDNKGLALLAEIAAEAGIQCFVERVGEGAEASVIIEDGEVKETRTK